MFAFRSGSRLQPFFRSSFTSTPTPCFSNRVIPSVQFSSSNVLFDKHKYSSYDGKLFHRNKLHKPKKLDRQNIRFGEDLGPKLDLPTKLKNQQRVMEKIQISHRSVRWAIAGNVAITVTKTVAAVLTGSSVLLSEAIHTCV